MDNDITAVFTIRLNMDDMAMLLARAMNRPVQVPFEVAQAAIDRVTATIGAATAPPVPVEAVEAVEAVEEEALPPPPAEKPSPGRRARAAAAPAAPVTTAAPSAAG